eukprot:1745242-Pleurochrysis_carterae.AAC.1
MACSSFPVILGAMHTPPSSSTSSFSFRLPASRVHVSQRVILRVCVAGSEIGRRHGRRSSAIVAA